jgi:pimeloyl-ACP methyl ester carboxylesterase
MRLARPDGVELHWETRGDGPPVAVCPVAWAGVGGVAEFVGDLACDHTVLTYDPRGTGASTRRGPYDVETDAGDLVALLEETGPVLAGIGSADGARRLIRAAAARPELVGTVVVSGLQGIGRPPERGLAGSRAVLDALVTLMESDYRAGLRATMERAAPGAEEQALRRRVEEIEAYCPQEAWLERLRAWIGDDLGETARALGSRLVILHHGTNPWFGGDVEGERAALPEARFVRMSDGLVDAAAENAAAVRSVVAAVRS